MTSKTKIRRLEERISEKLNVKLPPVPILWDSRRAEEKGRLANSLNTGKDKRESWELYFKKNYLKISNLIL